jgi:hypothetical protein
MLCQREWSTGRHSGLTVFDIDVGPNVTAVTNYSHLPSVDARPDEVGQLDRVSILDTHVD